MTVIDTKFFRKHIRSYGILKLSVYLFNHVFHAFKLPQDVIFTKIITNTKHASHLHEKTESYLLSYQANELDV